MPNTLLFGQFATGGVYRYDRANLTDAGTPFAFRLTTSVFAPPDSEVGGPFWQEAIYRTATLVMQANVGVTLRVTVIIDGVTLDGTLGNPDTRVTFTIATPPAGERIIQRHEIGLWRPLIVDGVTMGRVGVRGAWLQLQVDSTVPVTLPVGETNPDLRFDGVVLDVEPMLNTQQVVNP